MEWIVFVMETKSVLPNILDSFSHLYPLFTVAKFPDKNLTLQVHTTSPQNIMGMRDII